MLGYISLKPRLFFFLKGKKKDNIRNNYKNINIVKISWLILQKPRDFYMKLKHLFDAVNYE